MCPQNEKNFAKETCPQNEIFEKVLVKKILMMYNNTELLKRTREKDRNV